MIRPLTSLCLIAACGSGLYLYAEKHRAELLDRDIAHVIRATEAARERTGMLRAEWALLNDPSRLQALSDRFLHLQPMAPSQFVRLADLGAHLPPPEAPPPAGSTDDDESAPDMAAAPTAPAPAPPPPPPAAIAADPAPPAPRTETALRREEPPRPSRVAETIRPSAHQTRLAAAHERLRAHHVAMADSGLAHEGPLARGTPLPLAAPPPLGAPLVTAMAHPLRTPAPRRVVAAAPAYAGTYVRSAIGGTGTLPPPVPLAPGEP